MDICVESARIYDRRDDCALLWSGETSLQEILQLSQRMSRVLTTLSQNANVEFQFLLQQDEHERPSMQETLRDREPLRTSKLCVILYGSADVATMVGNWLDQCQLYLQLPHGCDRNVRYLNPHCLSSGDENRRMTFDIQIFSDANLQAKDPS
jgi:SWI/SNF-related matrix-associated actin-dependent regulator of chromatin subfamily A3